MMNKYKYSINIKRLFNMKLAEQFCKEVENLGYKRWDTGATDDYTSVHLSIGETLYNPSGKGEIGWFNQSVQKADFEFDITNKWEYEAALAIAAIRDDNKPYVGEWIDSHRSNVLNKGLWKINETIPYGSILSFNVEGRPSKNSSGTSDLTYCRKATPEEIITYMKEKYAKVELPAKWCIHDREVLDKENFKRWYEKEVADGSKLKWMDLGRYNHLPRTNSGIYFPNIEKGYTEITYSQWKQWYDQQQKEVETIKPTIMTKKLESFSIKGPINQYPDLMDFFKKKGGLSGTSMGYYNYNIAGSISYRGMATFEVITYKEWKEMIEGITDKKVIGYKLIKEYPGSPKMGETISKSTIHSFWYNSSGTFSISNPQEYPNYWEPIVEVEKKEITLRIECDDSFDLRIYKGKAHMNMGDGSVTIYELRDLQKLTGEQAKINNWNFSINTVNIGCKKNIPFKYLDEIIKAWDELNK